MTINQLIDIKPKKEEGVVGNLTHVSSLFLYKPSNLSPGVSSRDRPSPQPSQASIPLIARKKRMARLRNNLMRTLTSLRFASISG